MNKLILIITFISLFQSIIAQDIHFSMSHLSPLNLNPAETGNFNDDYRFHINQRTQWRSITVPYVTLSGSIDHRIKSFNIPGTLSAGLVINNDKAGDGHFGTTQISIVPSYFYSLDSIWSFSLGIMATWTQHHIDYSKFYFDNQYNGVIFDPSLPSSELFPKSQFHYFDVHSGLLIRYLRKNDLPVYLGLALFHINNPRKTFYNEFSVKLDKKWTTYIQSRHKINNYVYVLPYFYWFHQGTLNEMYIGGYLQQKTRDVNFQSFYIGTWFRFKDAAIISLATDYQNIHLAISYDINISPLVAASSGRGGLEIAIRYIFSKMQKNIFPEKHICPTFL